MPAAAATAHPNDGISWPSPETFVSLKDRLRRPPSAGAPECSSNGAEDATLPRSYSPCVPTCPIRSLGRPAKTAVSGVPKPRATPAGAGDNAGACRPHRRPLTRRNSSTSASGRAPRQRIGAVSGGPRRRTENDEHSRATGHQGARHRLVIDEVTLAVPEEFSQCRSCCLTACRTRR